jgi:NADH:ubiquinone oxidoreductase subunit E
MTARQNQTLKEVLESCRPATPARPNILQALLALQEAWGCVPAKVVPQIAHMLGVTDAQVAGVLSYYPDLHTEPPGRCLIQICTGESCTANHGGRVLRSIQEQLAIDVGETMPGGRFTLEKIYCLGNCAVSPTVIIGEDLYGRVVPSQVVTLLEKYR